MHPIEAIKYEWQVFKKAKYNFLTMDSGGFGGLIMGIIVMTLFVVILLICVSVEGY